MARVKLGDVAQEYKEVCKGSKDGLPVVGLEHITPEELTLSTWDDGKDNTFTKMFRKGQILFGRRRAYLKKAAIAPFDGICSGDITVIEAMPERILPDLLPFIIQNDRLFDYAVGKSAGSLSPRVKWEHLRDYSFELPSLNEQRALADILVAANAAKDAYKRLMAATDNLVKSQFIEMFGDPQSTCYGVQRIDEVCRLKSGTTFSQSAEHECGEYPYSKVADMNLPGNEVYITHTMSYVTLDTAGNSFIPKGAVIFPKRGGAIGTNKKRILIHDTCVDLNIMGVIPGDKINTTYLFAFFLNLDLGALCNGSTVPQLNNKDIGPLRIIIPPLTEQERFALLFSRLDKSKFALQQNIERLEMCRNALMQKAFS